MDYDMRRNVPGTEMPYIGIPFAKPSERVYSGKIGHSNPEIDEITPGISFSLARLEDNEIHTTSPIEVKKERSPIRSLLDRIFFCW